MDFEIALPQTTQEAIAAHEKGARWFAGGTDLIPELKKDLATPARLVNLKRVGELRGIEARDNSVRIGGLTTLAEIAGHALIRAKYRAVAQACELAASPQIRNVATLGGNLCQESRCAYFRNNFPCFLRGGDTCFMRQGENREAAVIGYGDCVHVHPSDPANALVAFDARIVVRGRAGERSVEAGEFFRAPDKDDTRMNVLDEGEMIVAVDLPIVSDRTRSSYVKAMDRAVWTFALASAAVVVEIGDPGPETVRVVVGGVAPTPWREVRIENALSGKPWNDGVVAQEAAKVLGSARPLAQNGYKARLARALVKRALTECWAGGRDAN